MDKQKEIKERLAAIVRGLESLENLELNVLESENALNELRINGNLYGLLTFARSVLQIANGTTGSHQHFDKHSMFDNCDRAVIIALKNAD